MDADALTQRRGRIPSIVENSGTETNEGDANSIDGCRVDSVKRTRLDQDTKKTIESRWESHQNVREGQRSKGESGGMVFLDGWLHTMDPECWGMTRLMAT
jgi:hypothetical protein